MSVSVLKTTVGSLLFVCAALDAVRSAIAAASITWHNQR
jgi:hypothetical protein